MIISLIDMKNYYYQSRRRDFLLGLSSLAITTSVGKCGRTDFLKLQPKNLSLKEIAANKGIIYGSYIEGDYQIFFSDSEFQFLFIQECSLLVVGFQWGRICPSFDLFDFTYTDKLVKFAAENQMLLRGQPLIYHSYQPQWLINKFQNSATTADEIRQVLVNSICTIVSRYAGGVHSWVVVNEAINLDDGRIDGLRDTKLSGASSDQGWGKYPTWLHFLGSDYIDLAFRTAAKADPQAMLIYNDYGFTYDTVEDEAKRSAVLKLLKYLKSKNTPIDALGIQSHLDASKNKLFNPQKLSKFMRDVAALGFKIIISELDVKDQQLPSNIKVRDRLVAEAYHDYLSVVLNEPAVIAVTTWGLSDRYTWLSWFAPREDQLPVRPLPYNEKLEPKLAFEAVANALKNAPKR